ncbi:UNVERIFIED_CONTAM: hypothetical protein FKN15_072312 [Acipenser sinensis]
MPFREDLCLCLGPQSESMHCKDVVRNRSSQCSFHCIKRTPVKIESDSCARDPPEKFLLPEINTSDYGRKCVVIDLDETLVHSSFKLEEAQRLVQDAITAGIFCDLGSGSNVDLCVISKGSVDILRPFDQPGKRGCKLGQYRYKKGTTAVLTKTVTPIAVELVEETVQRMDTE